MPETAPVPIVSCPPAAGSPARPPVAVPTPAPTPMPAPTPTPTPQGMRYGALIAMMCMSFLLVTSEFLPNGVLTQMASTLGTTPGQTGLTVGITALAGLLVAPTVGMLFPRLDRRTLLTAMALLGALSNLAVAIAPSFALILAARFLLGAALATFWTMSISVAARLAPPGKLGRAVMFVSAGTTLATVAGVPIGVLLAEHFEWRAVFALIGGAMLLLAVAVRALLPRVAPGAASSLAALGRVFVRRGIATALIGNLLIVLGHFVAYTYVRLALERVSETPGGPPITPGTVVMLLALFGAGGFVGNLAVGAVVDRVFAPLSVITPIVIAGTALTLIALPGPVLPVAIVVSAWGFFFASWLIIINTWIGYRLPHDLESGGSLSVVCFQIAIMTAASLGGVLVDHLGVEITYVAGAVSLVAGAVLFGLSNRLSR